MRTYLLSTDTLRARHRELLAARKTLDQSLGAITEALNARGAHVGPAVVAAHGTNAGYYAHRRTWRTPACAECRAAHAAAERARSYARAK